MLRFALLFVCSIQLVAQDRIGTVQVRVSTDRSDWRYELGQPVRFRIVAVQDGHPLSGIKLSYRIGPEMMPPKIEQTATLSEEGLAIDGGTMTEPGFLRCIATVEQNGKTYRGLATAAFHPESIKPTQQEPPDFDQFWAAGKAALARLPIDAKITPLPEYGNASADCYQVNLQNVGMAAAPSRFYGVLCEPKAPGKYPALLSVPGAGVRPYRGLAEMAAHGIITLLQPVQPVAFLLAHRDSFHLSAHRLSRGTFYFAQIGTSHIAATILNSQTGTAKDDATDCF